MDPAEVVRRHPFGDNPEVGAHGASTQRSILAAALDVFADHGYHDTNVELITRAAGCSRPAFYQYFASKQDVFWRLAGHLARELGRLVDNLGDIDADAAGVTALDGWLDELIDLYASYQPVFSSFQAAFREHGPHQALPRTMTARLVETLDATASQRASTGGSPSIDADVETVADATVAMILRSIHYWLAGLVDITRPRFTGALASTVHRVLFGPVATVNTGPTVHQPAGAVPAWPEAMTFAGERPLRPRGVKTRRDLLDAGRRVLPRRGYHDIRVDDIVEEAGRSHGSFYRYFDNKETLFRLLALEAGAELAELVDGFPTGPDGSLGDWLARWFATYRSNGGVISAWQEIGFEETDMMALSLDLVAVVFDRLERVVHTRGFGDTAVDAVALLAVLEHVPYRVLVLGYIDEDQAIAAAVHLIGGGILGRPLPSNAHVT